MADVTYDYAIIRIVPRVERGEQINVGVILSCTDSDVLELSMSGAKARIRALAPDIDMEAVREGLAVIPRVCAGGPAAGPIGELNARGRFRWLVSPRSTIIQASAVHTGRTSDPAATLQHLMKTMVR